MPYQLIYASRASQSLVPSEVKAILQHSQSANARIGVSGALIVHGRHFLQLLEGDASTICKLYQRILRDPRHEDMVLLAFSEIERPHFAEWSMGLLSVTAQNRAILLQHTGGESFDPLALDGAGASHLFDLVHENVRWLS